MDEGAGRRASPTTGTRSKSVVGAAELRPRERRGPYDGVVRVVVSATRARRDHLTRRLLPALRDASEDADALDVRVHTSDADLCDAVRAADPRTRCERTAKTATMTATMTATIDASSVTNPSSKDSKDSAARREWYARETTDMIAALESAEASGDAADDAAVLFLEDDVIPATSWETKLRTSVGRHATRDDATSTWWCDFDVFSLYAAGWDSGEDGHVGAFESGTQALFFARGRATNGEASPREVRRGAAGLAHQGRHARREGAIRGAESVSARVRAKHARREGVSTHVQNLSVSGDQVSEKKRRRARERRRGRRGDGTHRGSSMIRAWRYVVRRMYDIIGLDVYHYWSARK